MIVVPALESPSAGCALSDRWPAQVRSDLLPDGRPPGHFPAMRFASSPALTLSPHLRHVDEHAHWVRLLPASCTGWRRCRSSEVVRSRLATSRSDNSLTNGNMRQPVAVSSGADEPGARVRQRAADLFAGRQGGARGEPRGARNAGPKVRRQGHSTARAIDPTMRTLLTEIQVPNDDHAAADRIVRASADESGPR